METTKIQIDPKVALEEVMNKAEADEKYYRNRCLVMRQRIYELEAKIKTYEDAETDENKE